MTKTTLSTVNKDLNLWYLQNSLGIDLDGSYAVAASILNILNTPKYTRYFNREFGCSIEEFLFEDMNETTADCIRMFLLRDFTEQEPRIGITIFDINVVGDPDNNTYTVSINYHDLFTKTSNNFTTLLKAQPNGDN